MKPGWGPQTDTQEDFDSLPQEMEGHGSLYEPEYSEEDLKHMEEEEEEEAAPAAAAEKQAQPVGEDEELKPEWTACVNACVVRL